MLGAGGQLGRSFQRIAVEKNLEKNFEFWTRSDFDICNEARYNVLDERGADIVIHCAAYTAVDKAETERELAYAINTQAVKDLGMYLAARNIPMIHFSSDYVYHNYLRRPLRETDPCRPKGYYAKTKFWGEKALAKCHPLSLVLRVSWLYSEYGHNFPKTILRLARNRDSLNVVTDQKGAPTYAPDLASACIGILKKSSGSAAWKKLAGVYNYCNEGSTSWHEIAEVVVSEANISCDINPIKSVSYPTPAPRPRYSVLNVAKFQRKFDLPIYPWRQRLIHCVASIINESA